MKSWLIAALLSIISTLILKVYGQALDAEGLYLATPREIYFVEDPSSASSYGRTVYIGESYSRFVGLAVDRDDRLLFWSDISISGRGIYQASINDDGTLYDNRTLVDTDIQEINGMSVDWVHNNLYWTDARRKTIEVINFKTKHRRILFSESLINPRGIYADPINGYLFWNDQGRRRIERSRLDGTNRTEIIGSQRYPNQMVVYMGNLYWVNSDKKTLERSNLDGIYGPPIYSSPIKSEIFGLAIRNDIAYITTWAHDVLVVNLTNPSKALTTTTFDETQYIFSAAFYGAIQPASTDGCQTGNCSHLCLAVDSTRVRCSCPSFGALVVRKGGQTCQAVSSGNILLYALGGSGFVGFIPIGIETEERYFIGQSLRPVSVAYDPVRQLVYWSDVSERMVRRSSLNGTSRSVVLSDQNGLGIVDGMELDYVNNKLYYSHYGYISVDGSPYTWHKIEVLDLNGPSLIRTIVDGDEKPRAIAVDIETRHIYYTDWSDNARIVRTNLDGSDPVELRAGLDNPNGLALVGTGASKRLYYIDSHFKTRENENYPGDTMNGSVYSIKTDGTGFRNESTSGGYQLQTPIGMTWNKDSSLFYISDWDRRSVVALDLNHGLSGNELLSDVESPMMVVYRPYSIGPPGPQACSAGNGGCSDVCFTGPLTNVSCNCNSYSTSTITNLSDDICYAPDGFAVVGDFNSLKLYGLDGTDESVYTAVQGQPYFANIVATAQDPRSNYIYFSDVHSKWIMRTGFKKNTTQFYRINHVIDGMTVYSTDCTGLNCTRLYWTDSTNGQINYIDLPPDGSSPPTHTAVLIGLTRPRAIKIYNSYIYWTQWGDRSGKVLRIGLTTIHGTEKDAEPLRVPSMSWANGLYIDEAKKRMYVSDGHPDTKNVYNCTVDGTDCIPVAGLTEKLDHVYDIWVYNDILYYSDWKSKAVIAYSPIHKRKWSIIDNLMRPTQIYLKFPANAATKNHCTKNNGGCSDICVSLLGSRGCTCGEGSLLSIEDQATCVRNNSRDSCDLRPNGLKQYIYQESFKPVLCTGCQCLAGDTGHAIFGDIVYNSSRCNRIGTCPPPVCGGDGAVIFSRDQCCPVCKAKCDVKITNCPVQPFYLRMTEENPYVVDEFLPALRDCTDKARVLTLKRNPPQNIFTWSSENRTVTWTAGVEGGRDDTCTYTIITVDDLPPRIRCPNTTIVVARGDTVPGRWTAPTATDNAGIKEDYPICFPKWDSPFTAGSHNVTCTAIDVTDHIKTCTFEFIYKKEPLACPVQYLNNGQLMCRTDSEGRQICDIVCNQAGGYQNTQSFKQLKCDNGKWQPEINENVFTVTTCKRRIKKPLSGNITVVARNICRSNTVLKFTVDYLQKEIIDNYLWRSYFSLVSTVRVKGCGNQIERTEPRKRRAIAKAEKNDIAAEIVISGNYDLPGYRPILKQDIDEILRLVADDFNRQFLKINCIRKEERYTYDTSPEIESHPAVEGCLEGTVEVDDGCDVCPAGMYTLDRKTCVPCDQGSYNEWEAQEQCAYCPKDQTSPQGSYYRKQCNGKGGCNRACIIGLAVGLGGGLILILIIAIIVLAVCLRRSKKSEKRARDNAQRTWEMAAANGVAYNGGYEQPGNVDELGKPHYELIDNDNRNDSGMYYNDKED